MKNLEEGCGKLVKLCLKHNIDLGEDAMTAADVVRGLQLNSSTDRDSVEKLRDASKTLWADEGVKRAYELSILETSVKDQMNPNDAFFLNQVDVICAEGYMPTDEDMLRMRRSTSGSHSLDFEFEPEKFGQKGKKSFWTITDVGGQIHERATWYEQFNELDGLIFVLSLSDFDQMSQDSRGANKFVEDGVQLMLQVMRAETLQGVPVVVMLNKADIFKTKLLANKDVGIKKAFPNYPGDPDDVNASSAYIRDFIRSEIEAQSSVSQNFYITMATDTNMVKNVISKVILNILTQSLQNVGMI